MPSSLTWRGDQVKARIRAASAESIDEIHTAAAEEAASAWPVDTGLSRASIDVLEAAHDTGSGIRGAWGGRELPASEEYSESSRRRVFFEEVGVEGRPGLNILRRTADRWNATLATRIRGRLR